MTSPSDRKMRSAWTPDKQADWRAKHPAESVIFHCLLDASGSMQPYAEALRKAYNSYLAWLKQHASPMAMLETRCFTEILAAGTVQPLRQAQALTPETYQPHGGTHLYEAVGTVATATTDKGSHILIVFTDGGDMSHWQDHDDGERQPSTRWTAVRCATVLTTLQDQEAWLAVFLGAFPEALDIGRSMGFKAGNCLVFAAEQLPEAFTTLQHATQRYLKAPVQERKLLAAGGVF